MDIATPRGTGRIDLWEGPDVPAYLLVLTHGSNGGVDAPDLAALREAALGAGAAVAGVTQPYRLAGRRTPGAATAAQDEAWRVIVERLRSLERFARVPLVLAGRSNGARVACRTARALGAVAVVALAFPLRPPGKPERTRVAELREAGVDTLVVNGERDPFGIPEASDATTLVVRPGERHDLARDPEGTAGVVVEWLAERVARTGAS